MWISKMLKPRTDEEMAESGSVTISGNRLETDSSVTTRQVTAYSPYGYCAIPPVGERVMLVPSADGQAIIGTRLKASTLASGEVKITSKGGASIVLKNDGSVVINSLVINKKGEIVK